MKTKTAQLVFLCFLPLWGAAAQTPAVQTPTPAAGPLLAHAQLLDARGGLVGSAEFREEGGVVALRVNLNGFRAAAPGGHGLHLHAVGACAPTFAAAGGHFNPAAQAHGFLNQGGHHAGDLPNLTVDARGDATLEARTTRVTLREGPASLLDADGTALVVHAGPDDYHTDPAGASGDRLACGVLRPGPLSLLAAGGPVLLP